MVIGTLAVDNNNNNYNNNGYSTSTASCYMIVCRPLIARTDDHTHYITFFNFFKPLGNNNNNNVTTISKAP